MAEAIECKNQVTSVEVLPEPQIPVIPFAVSLPPSTLQNFDDPTQKKSPLALMGDNAIVGSIVLLNKSAMVWVGWGNLDMYGSGQTGSNRSTFGKGTPTMGQLVVAMPRTNYKGAFGTGSKEPSCSHIIGSESSDDQMLASQMASRLSMRSGMAVFVSCQLSSGSNDPESWLSGMDSEMISHRAAAMAEKEIWRILQEQQVK